MVSVVMPAYNRAGLIGQAIESVLAQTYGDFELLVVDDGSSDLTAEVVAGYLDPRVRLLRHPHNRGCSAAYNTGFAAATGQLISILDSDDLWRPDKLKRDLAFLECHPEADAVFTDLEKEDSGQCTTSFMRAAAEMCELLGTHGWPHEIVFSRSEMFRCLLQGVPV